MYHRPLEAAFAGSVLKAETSGLPGTERLNAIPVQSAPVSPRADAAHEVG